MVKGWYDSGKSLKSWTTNSTVGDRVWYRWMYDATPIYSLNQADPWPHWCQVTNASTTYNVRSTEPVWIAWNGEDVGSIRVGNPYGPRARQARLHRAADDINQRTQREREQREQARRTARQLLVSHLNARQQETFEAAGHFDVISEHGRRYRIYTDRMQHNVFLIDDRGNHLFELCCHTTGVPVYDNAMAQKLYLEHAEDMFLLTANIWDRRHGSHGGTVSREGEAFEFPAGLGEAPSADVMSVNRRLARVRRRTPVAA